MMDPWFSDPSGYCTNQVPQAPWDEVSSGNPAGDRRTVSSSGPFTLEPGSEDCVDYAFIFGQGDSVVYSGLFPLFGAADSAFAFYQQNNPCSCDPNPLSVSEAQPTTVGIYPNPANDKINVVCGDNATGSSVEILDVHGNVVITATVLSGNSSMIDVTTLSSGLYFVRVNKGSVALTGKFVRN